MKENYSFTSQGFKITDDRVVLHSDLNNFFASVEMLSNPSLREVPMAVCGNEKERHGIVLAKNDRAKKYGVKTGETIKSAKEKCRDLVTCSSHYSEYVRYSRMVRNIYLRYTSRVEPFGIDEAWLDVSELSRRFSDTPFERARLIAQEIKNVIKNETGLCVSVGISFNKIFSKLASDMKNKGSITAISPDDYKSIVGKLPVRDLLYVGENTEYLLKQNRLFTLADVSRHSRKYLKELFGKNGENVWDFANGYDFSPVNEYVAEENGASVSNSRTLPYDITSPEDCENVLFSLCECVTERIRARGMTCKRVRVFIRYNDLSGVARQAKRERATDSVFDIFSDAASLVGKNRNFEKPVRALGVGLEDLEDARFLQISVFDNLQKVDFVMDAMKERYGDGSIQRASALVKKELSQFNKKHPAFNHNI